MSNKALTWAFEAAIGNVGAKFVLVALADHAGDHKGEDWSCFPAIERLMEYTSMGERTVRRHLDWLVANKWISRKRRPGRTRDEAVYDYRLHRDQTGEPPANLAADGSGAPAANLAGDAGPDQRPNSTRPPAKLANPPHPPIELNPQLTLREPVRARS